MKEPKLVTATDDELDDLLRLAKTNLPTKQYELLEGVLATFVYVMLKLQNAKTSIKRFQRMVFGHSTEHKRNVLERAADSAQPGQVEPDLDSGQDPPPPGNATVVKPPRPRHTGVSDGADPRLFDGEDAVFGFAGVRRWPVAVGVSPRAEP